MPNKLGINQHTPQTDETGAPVDKSKRTWYPPKWAHAYVSVCLDPEIAPVKSKRCEVVGIERSTLWNAEKDPRFVAWFDAKMKSVIAGESRDVRTALLRQCLGGNLEAIKLYHELYERYIPTERKIFEGDIDGLSNQQLAELASGLAKDDPQGAGEKIH